jgi:hypothetical protein
MVSTVKVVIDNLAYFLSISPNQTKFFPLSLPGLNRQFLLLRIQSLQCLKVDYCWNSKLLSGTRIFKLLNLCGNQLISIP